MTIDAETNARLAALRIRMREHKARKAMLRAQRAQPAHAPERYDEVYYRGVADLDALAFDDAHSRERTGAEPRHDVEAHPEPYGGPINCPYSRRADAEFVPVSKITFSKVKP